MSSLTIKPYISRVRKKYSKEISSQKTSKAKRTLLAKYCPKTNLLSIGARLRNVIA